jgi:hypothetical protein
MPDISATGVRHTLRERIDRINDAYGLLFVMTIATFVILSGMPDDAWARMAGIAASGLTVFIGLASSHVPRQLLHVAVVLTAVAMVLSGVAAAVDRDWVGFCGASLIVLLMLVTEGAILSRTVLATDVSSRTILGALSAYTMFGILFAYVYLATRLVQGEPFFDGMSHAQMSDMIFFSYTTLTTTGYGNLIPAGEPGQSFAVIEMLFGQIFLVTLVARLVSMWKPRGISLKEEIKEAADR